MSADLCRGLAVIAERVYVAVDELAELLQQPPFNFEACVEVLVWRAIFERERRSAR